MFNVSHTQEFEPYHKASPTFFYLASISTPFNYRKVLLEPETSISIVLPLKSPIHLQIKNLESTMNKDCRSSPLMDHTLLGLEESH